MKNENDVKKKIEPSEDSFLKEKQFKSNYTSSHFRKSSAEIVNEARSLLIGRGARIVSTRRPITPKEYIRKLYGGKEAIPGRPPSSFSLHYLQIENGRSIASLAPLPKNKSVEESKNIENFIEKSLRKNGSIESTLDKIESTLEFKNKEKQKNLNLLLPLAVSGNSKEILKSKSDGRLITSDGWERKFCSPSYLNSFCKYTKKCEIKRKPFDLSFGNVTKTKCLSQASTQTIIELLQEHDGIKDCCEETIQHLNGLLVEMYYRVKAGLKGELVGAVLSVLYSLVECSSPKILLAIARVVLTLSVKGSNLTGACKLMFKVARNDANDYLFNNSNVPELLIDGLGYASPIDDPEACIYGYGAIRFLVAASVCSTDSTITNFNNQIVSYDKNNRKEKKGFAKRLIEAGAIQLLVLHLQILNDAGSGNALDGQALHAFFQLSAVLRVFAGFSLKVQTRIDAKCYITSSLLGEQYYKQKGIENMKLACPHLIKAAEITLKEDQIQKNIVRTLSVMSDNDECCEAFSEYVGRFGILLGPCNKSQDDIYFPIKSLGVLTRIGYILGNIMARSNNARLQFYQNDVSMEYLLNILQYYSKKNFLMQSECGDTVIEALVKFIRVIANMSVNAEVGHKIGFKPILGEVLLRLINTINKMLSTNLINQVEELLQAILGAMHNLFFYQDQLFKHEDTKTYKEISNSGFTSTNDLISHLAVALSCTLKLGSSQIKAEVARVLGNMTRSCKARDAFCSVNGLKTITHYLKFDNFELKSTCSGVLVNLLSASEHRLPFKEESGPLILNEIFKESVKKFDWSLADIICQALWNYLIDSKSIIDSLGEMVTESIYFQLVEYLDEEKIFKGNSPSLDWEQFAHAATDLLEKIQLSLENNKK